MGNKMEMHPVTTILLLIGSSSVWGLWGVIFGIPIYAILKIIILRVYNYYRNVSQVFKEDEDDEDFEDATGHQNNLITESEEKAPKK